MKVKSISYLESRLSWFLAQQKGKDEAIFLSIDDFLQEGSRSNIFFVRGNEIMTPSLECGLLDGITRRVVIGLIKESGFVFKEGRFRLKDLMYCDEAFLTSSLMEIMPVIEVDSTHINGGVPGCIAYKLRRLYRQRVSA
jgi:branched-subunit amino acid aminotransferase/4-amino-4-deoxychorismate lyase